MVKDEPKLGVKNDEGKTRFDLTPWVAVEMMTLVMQRVVEEGEYPENNWRKGLSASRLFAAAFRHLFAWWRGEHFDPKTNLPHMAHLMCCAAFILELQFSGKLIDNREDHR